MPLDFIFYPKLKGCHHVISTIHVTAEGCTGCNRMFCSFGFTVPLRVLVSPVLRSTSRRVLWDRSALRALSQKCSLAHQWYSSWLESGCCWCGHYFDFYSFIFLLLYFLLLVFLSLNAFISVLFTASGLE